MNLKEAYDILGLSSDSSPDEAKKAFRKKAAKYHPDINKEPDAEDKFKKINEAYKRIESGEDSDSQMPDFSGFGGFGGFPDFMGFRQQGSFRRRDASNISLDVLISFKDSVTGIKKDISFNRKGKCIGCDGNGESLINNGCTKCNGLGQITRQQGNMIFMQTCDSCKGQVKKKSCEKCNNTGELDTNISISVNIPGGVTDSSVLRLSGLGNFVGKFMGSDQFTDAFLKINVTPDENGLTLDGKDVVLKLNISLLEAVRGCDKTVKTVFGDKDIKIKPLSKNLEEIVVPNFGVNRIGNQKIILDVEYPKDTSKLIDSLLQLEV